MKTLRLAVDPANLESPAARQAIAQSAEILRRGGTVAFPTETVYGLGANALDSDAVAKIFAAKERPGWDPIIVHISDPALLARVATSIPTNAGALMDAFWPGPLTLLLPKHPGVPEAVTAGRERVGVRMPAHPVALALLRAAGVPVAAPSANRFGRTSATTAAHVAQDLDSRIDAILDGGPTTHGVESTVADVRDEICTIFRPGVITLEQMRSVLGSEVREISADAEQKEPDQGAVAPGLGMRHYAPRARLVLVDGEVPALQAVLAATARGLEEAGDTVGLMLPAGFRQGAEHAHTFDWGNWDDADELARRLFAGLRWLDSQGVTVIVCPVPSAQGIGVALRDRLRKAARRLQSPDP
ncbi:MAG TPA: L-threonylcarbamoyladenylate synthase [Acidobacteriaceae bacterium]|nr:L-threonylcarbamoyladenylate synthase [Acidobacteriaceae bacterium]